MKRFLAAMMLALMIPVSALAVQIQAEPDPEGSSQLFFFSTQEEMPQAAPGKQAPVDPVKMAIDMQIAVRFEQEQAKKAADRSLVRQNGTLYQDGKIASMARTWQGEQANGREGSSAAALTVSLETGMEIYFDELFADYEGAVAAMEAIISDEVLEDMSDYMEYADLLPMPTDCYAITEQGLTIYYPEDRYRYFDGESGSVTFLWHEIADYIGENSPVYEISRPQFVHVSELRSALALGTFDEYLSVRLHMELGRAQAQERLGDPDYTRDALVYPLERKRGFALEIPKYAETAEEETPVSAIRASNIATCGIMTGKTTIEELYAIFGEPERSIVYDEDTAADALLEPGESLFFEEMGGALQAHFDEGGVLSCLILRNALPESL